VDIVLLIKAAIMGLVEGLTEFLPISSTGHLILAGALLGFDDEKAKVFDIAIQTGAIFAVILVYWQKIRDTLVALPSQRQAQSFALNVAIAFFPAVLLGLLFGKAIKAHLFTPVVVASTFILGGFIILWAEARQKRNPALARIDDVDAMTAMDALKVGLVQCLAMVPGTSRSGATIIGGMFLGSVTQGGHGFLVLSCHSDADWCRGLQPVQGACPVVDGRPAHVWRRAGGVFFQCLAVYSLVAAIYFHPQFCRLCLLPDRFWPGGAGHCLEWCCQLDGLSARRSGRVIAAKTAQRFAGGDRSAKQITLEFFTAQLTQKCPVAPVFQRPLRSHSCQSCGPWRQWRG
jgi:undecaprenyl-diphosphatase UppP